MIKSSQIRTYNLNDSVSFRTTRERFGGLSNMASGFPIEVNGVQILTSEALYQACRFPDRPDVQRIIIEQRSPMTAKMKSRRFQRDTRSDWEWIRVMVMGWCLRVKLAQNWDEFGELLLSTGNAPIVEDSRKDDFWGAKRTDDELIGTNALGRLLMELRKELKGPNHDHLRVVEPLQIPDFLLYGQPIGKVVSMETHTSQEGSYPDSEMVGMRVSQASIEWEKSHTSAPNPVTEGQETEIHHNPDEHINLDGNNMIPKECKRLAEVDFPIAEVSKHAVREKSIRHGHPSTLHLWWARRPLASCRSLLMALLLPDPCDEYCPEGFKLKARQILLNLNGRPKSWTTAIESDEGLRRIILKFIADFANWDNAADSSYLETGRALVKAAHGEEAPLVVDPFAGGGSIPLEALRLGCEAFASDLNPVACLILKVMLEDIPRHGPELAKELRKVGAEIKAKAEEELTGLYPTDPDGATPIAYLWARTVRCEAPNCGAEIPLMRSFWLCKKANRKWALQHRVERSQDEPPTVEFEIFEPKSDREVPGATVTRAKATCVCCGAVLPPERVRAQLATQTGGADAIFDTEGNRTDGARMTAVVTLRPDEKGRHYRLPTDADYEAVRKAQERVAQILMEWDRSGKQGLCPVPDEPTPAGGGSGAGRAFSVQRYGMFQWGDLFTARQKVALVALARLISKSPKTTGLLLAIAANRTADGSASVSSWLASGEEVKHVFARQALPIVWDFGESNYMADASRSWASAINSVAKVLESSSWDLFSGQVQQADATDHPLPDQSTELWFTDPPYYDAIPYSDLSDFFLVWLKRTLPDNSLLRNKFDLGNPLSPKTSEAVQDETRLVNGRPKDREWFEETMAKAFSEGRRVLSEDGVGSVVFAHKTTEGWEALLSGMIRGGWTLTGSWPIATEMTSRLRARDSAALATSIHLICRPRPEDAPIGDWADVLRELPARVADWIERLQGEGIRGADLVFACIGPALEIFSRYRAVETAEGDEVGLPEYLEKVWEVVGRAALQQVLGTGEAQARNGLAGALEEDARLTALFLWTLQSTEVSEENGKEKGEDDEEAVARVASRGFSLPFDVVRRFAQPMGIDLDTWNGRIIDQKKGVVRLLPVSERSRDLFGEDGAGAAADWIENDPRDGLQMSLFPSADAAPRPLNRRRGKRAILDGDAELQTLDATTLDRVHAAMLLQSSGHANALRTLIDAEQDRGPDFLRLANALSALYPRGSQEKRLLDAMLLAVPR